MPNLTARQSKSLDAALLTAPPTYRDGLLRNIFALLGDNPTHTQLISAMEQVFFAEGLDEIAPLNYFDRYYLFGDTLGVLQATSNARVKLVQRQAAPAALGGAGALTANIT